MSLYVNIEKKLENFTLKAEFETDKNIFALLGASGCGKSMTLKCIAGIEKPDKGKIILNGKVLFDSEKKIFLAPQERKIGYMFQDYALFKNMTVRENIACGISKKIKRNEKNEIIKGILKSFNIEELENQYPDKLSGGQKQRTAMARIIASAPDAVLLDEPFSALDSYLKWKMINEMEKHLKALDKPVIFVSHDRDEVYRMSDNIGAMNKGKIEVVESKKEFFNNPKTVSAAILSGCKNISPAVKIDNHHIFAEVWGIKLFSSRKISDDIKFVGIRAHDFIPDYNQGSGVNIEEKNVFSFSRESAEYEENPFEWTVYFRGRNSESLLQWKISKNLFKDQKAYTLSVSPDKILLLKE